MDRSELQRIVYEAVADFNLRSGLPEPVVPADETPLLGEDSELTSLALVNLIVEVEQHLEDGLEIVITLADDRAMSRRRSPFSTIGTLIDYVEELLRSSGLDDEDSSVAGPVALRYQ